MSRLFFEDTNISDETGKKFNFMQGVMFDGTVLRDTLGNNIEVLERDNKSFAVVGEIKRFGGAAPANWIKCDGHFMTEEEKALYPELAKTLENISLVDLRYPFGEDAKLVAKYRFNYNVQNMDCRYDLEGYDIEYVDGKFNKCIKLNGTSSYVDMNMYTETLVKCDIKFSISLFVKAESLPDDYQVVINFGGKSNGFGIGYNPDHKLMVGLMDNDNNYTVVSDVDTYDQWHHVAVTYDPTIPECKFYVDGIYVGKTNNRFRDGSNEDAIGRTKQRPLDGSGQDDYWYFNGYVDQLEIYHDVLNDGQVESLALQTSNYWIPDIENGYIKAKYSADVMLQDEGFLGSVKIFNTDEVVPDSYVPCDGSDIDANSEYGKYLADKGVDVSNLTLPNIADTDTEKYRIKVKQFATSEINNIEANSYKIEEVLTTERFVNNKPIYKRSFDIGELTADTEKSIDVDIANIEFVTKIEYIFIEDDKIITQANSGNSYAYYDKNNKIICKNENDSSLNLVTIYYTKTDDNENSPVAHNYVQVNYKDTIIGMGIKKILNNADLSNNWINYGDGYDDAGYVKRCNIVKLTGVIKDGDNGTVFVLPEGFKPTAKKAFLCINNTRVDVDTDGNVIVQTDDNGFVSLENVVFEV